MKKISFSELCEKMTSHNLENNVKNQFGDDKRILGYIVFKSSNWSKKFPLLSRTYAVFSDNKMFISGMGGNSLFGNCLDGSDIGIRLDWYLPKWEIDYCYF